MDGSGHPSEISTDDVLGVFVEADPPCVPLTAAEIAGKLNCARHIAERKLTELLDRGEVSSKALDATARVWWRPPARTAVDRSAAIQRSGHELERYQTIVEAVGDAIYVVDEDQRFTMVNRAAEELTGYSREEILGSEVADFIGEEAAARARELGESLSLGDNDVASAEFDLSTADGRNVPLEVRFARLPTTDGRVERVGIAREISDRKARERELQAQHERYRQLVETSPAPITIYTAEGTIAYVNDAAVERIAAESADDLLGASAIEFVHPDDRPEAVERMRRVIEDRVAVPPKDTKLIDLNGELRYTVISSSPITYDGKPAAQVIINDITERRERELELERYETIVETVEDGIYAVDAEYCFTLANPALASLYGKEPEALLGEHISAVVDPETVQQAEGLRERLRASGETTATVEIDVETGDGDERTLEVKYAFSPDGGTVGVIRDITERKGQERALEKSERRYRTLVEHFPNGAVALVDEDIRYRTIGGTPLEEANATIDELKGQPVGEILPPELADLLVPKYQAAFRGQASTFEGTFNDHVYQFHIVPVRESDGTVFAALGMSQDITEVKRYQRKLEESERRYRTLAENFPNGAVALFDEDLRYTAAGGQLLDEVYSTVGDPVGDRVLDRYPDAIVAEVESHFRATFTGETNEFEATYLGRHLRAHTLPIHDADGKIAAGMLVVQDITERTKYRRQLEATIEKLEESNERLRQFAYISSHDLQEPLRMISSYLQLLEDRYHDELDDDAGEFIDFAVDAADRMREMIQDLLMYSRVDSEGEPFEPTDGNALINRVLDQLRLQIDEADAEVIVEDLPTVVADENQLEQVFQNLVSNAIKYRGDAPPRIEIDSEPREDEWVFQVADNGIGIDPDHADQVFEVFRRLHSDEEYPGTGIGLALCKKIVQRHGGRMWVESDPGEGATFCFTLPVEIPDGGG